MGNSAKRFLIVEDDLSSQKLLVAMLKPYGECVTAADKEGFDKFCEAHEAGRPFDLITLDIMMPKASGTECLSSLRAHEVEVLNIPADQRTKVIMTTALDDTMTVFDAHAQGCTQYLVKPIEKNRLLMTLQRLHLAD